MRNEKLFNFFAGYFHQDWPEEHGTAESAVESYVADLRDPIEMANMADAVQNFLDGCSSEGELQKRLFEELGSYHVPVDSRRWIERVIDRLRQAAETGEDIN